MDKAKLLAILDKNIDQEGLVKDMMMEFALPYLMKVKADVEAGVIDPLPETSLDKTVLVMALDFLIEKAKV